MLQYVFLCPAMKRGVFPQFQCRDAFRMVLMFKCMYLWVYIVSYTIGTSNLGPNYCLFIIQRCKISFCSAIIFLLTSLFWRHPSGHYVISLVGLSSSTFLWHHLKSMGLADGDSGDTLVSQPHHQEVILKANAYAPDEHCEDCHIKCQQHFKSIDWLLLRFEWRWKVFNAVSEFHSYETDHILILNCTFRLFHNHLDDKSPESFTKQLGEQN